MSWTKRPSFRAGSAFWLFGLINNVLYVIILSAAVDLVPASIPKSVVLFADDAPAFIAKLTGPYFINSIPYGVRMCIYCAMSIFAMFAVASLDSVALRLIAVGVASASSGWGEMSFLSLTHFYPGGLALAGFSSGTGAAGLIGAGLYALFTTSFGLSSQITIYCSSVLPVIILLGYFVVLPRTSAFEGYQNVSQGDQDDDADEADASENSALAENVNAPKSTVAAAGFRANLARVQKLIYPYMLPLFIVYTAEYVAISGVAPTLLFPLESSPFKQLRDFYPAYNAVYQLGVFISRSSIYFFRIHNIYTPSLLQIIDLGLLIFQALFFVIPTVWLIFIMYFYIGLLGGACYANTFAKITDEISDEEREFSLGAVSVADSFGIIVASVLSMPLEPLICGYQSAHGRDWCKRV